MKSITAAATCVAFACTAGAAVAADLLRPVPAASPAVLYNWTGFYVGANLGYSWGRTTTDFDFAPPVGPPHHVVEGHLSPDGVIGGGQIGFNWQAPGSAWVFGVEADFQGSGQRESQTFVCPVGTCAPAPITVDWTDRLTWFGTVRGRGGLAVDRFLLYVTGGLAYGEFKTDFTASGPAGRSIAFSHSSTPIGWTIGGGVEAALWGNITGKVEYLFMDFDRVTSDHGFAGIGTVLRSAQFQDHVIRAGLNLRF